MGMNGLPPPPAGQQPCRKCGGDGYAYQLAFVMGFIPWLKRARCQRCIHVMERNADGLWLDPEQRNYRPQSAPKGQGGVKKWEEFIICEHCQTLCKWSLEPCAGCGHKHRWSQPYVVFGRLNGEWIRRDQLLAGDDRTDHERR